MDLVQNLLIKIKKKLSMDLVYDRGSMDPVHESGPWTPGPCFVLTPPAVRQGFVKDDCLRSSAIVGDCEPDG